MRQGGEVYYLHGDHLGSTSLTTDDQGSVVHEARYLPFGEERWVDGEGVTDFTFTGQRKETGFDLHDYNARFYSSRLGRFISPDSIVPDFANPQSLNRLSYVVNNPVKFIDPTGHCGFDAQGNINKFDCTVDDFQALNWEERLQWGRKFVESNKLEFWFEDILGVISDVFMGDPTFENLDGFTAYADAGILQAINDGWRLYQGQSAIGAPIITEDGIAGVTHGGTVWAQFFQERAKFQQKEEGTLSQDALDRLRLDAEQYGANYANSLYESQRRYASESLYDRHKIDTFILGANLYRASCPCLGGRINPRTSWPLLRAGSIFGEIGAALSFGNRVEMETGIYAPRHH
jgi:RHS repeat-associated protein